MSAKLLWCSFVLGTYAAAAIINSHDIGLITSLQNNSLSERDQGITIYSRNRRIVVEEVDKNGNSILKELELPDYDISEELQEDKRRTEQQRKEYQTDVKMSDRRYGMYGCFNEKDVQQKKCLQRQKKRLKKLYQNWKSLIRRMIKDLEKKIKKLKNNKKEYTGNNLNFMAGFSPENAKRKKE